MKIEIDSILESQIRRYERSVIRESGVGGLSIVLSMLVKEMDSHPPYKPLNWSITNGDTVTSVNP